MSGAGHDDAVGRCTVGAPSAPPSSGLRAVAALTASLRVGGLVTTALLLLIVVSGCVSLSVGIGGSDADPAPAATALASGGPAAGLASAPAVGTTGSGSGAAPRPSRVDSPGAAGPSDGSFAPRIGYISLDEDLAFVRTVTDSIRAAAAGSGLELVECDPDWTREGVRRCAERLGSIGVDGLVSFQPFAELADEVCALTGSVPTAGLVFDQGPCQVTGLRIDQAEAGRMAGAAVGAFAKRRWECEISAFVSLESSDQDPDGKARMAGYRSGYEEHCPLPRRIHILDGADRLVTAQTSVARLLDDLRGRRIVVVGINEDAVLGAMAAAAEAGRGGDLWYSGQLADPAIRRSIACDRRYLASVAQFPERFGEQVVPLLLEAMRGQEVPTSVDAGLELVTTANVRELFPDTPTCEES